MPFDEISYGYRIVTLFSEEELDEEQKGYSTNAAAGEVINNWNKNWLVIGREDLAGDQLVVDSAIDELPVFNRGSRWGDWNPILVATSLRGFIKSLLEVMELSNGRSNPVKLKKVPGSYP